MNNQKDQGKRAVSSAEFPGKKKRGRPRKDDGPVQVQVSTPPDRAISDDDNMIGEAFTGVVDAIFDDGYLLTARIGNSDTLLRGVLFKTGRTMTVTPENNVAPYASVHGNSSSGNQAIGSQKQVPPFKAESDTPVELAMQSKQGNQQPVSVKLENQAKEIPIQLHPDFKLETQGMAIPIPVHPIKAEAVTPAELAMQPNQGNWQPVSVKLENQAKKIEKQVRPVKLEPYDPVELLVNTAVSSSEERDFPQKHVGIEEKKQPGDAVVKQEQLTEAVAGMETKSSNGSGVFPGGPKQN